MEAYRICVFASTKNDRLNQKVNQSFFLQKIYRVDQTPLLPPNNFIRNKIIAITSNACMRPPLTWNANMPNSQPIIRITAMMYNKFPMICRFNVKIQLRPYYQNNSATFWQLYIIRPENCPL